jgi:hypothetical protein
MAMDRRKFLALGAAGGAAWLSACNSSQKSGAGQAALAPAAETTFTMTVFDGYAYVFMDSRAKLVIGAIDTPSMKHPLLMRVENGKVRGTPPVAKAAGANTYDFTGWHVELELGASAKALTLPGEAWLNPMRCPKTLTEWNNLAWLPPASKIYNGAPMVKDWPAKLSSRMVVKQGLMTVRESDGPGLWTFKNAKGEERWKQPMSDGTRFVQEIKPTDTVVFKLFKNTPDLPAAGAAATDQFVIESAGSGISLAVFNGVPPGPAYQIGQPVPHFGRYAALVNTTEIILPYFGSCEDGTGSCPGDFCPYGRFEV